ncbi:MAG: methyltransferase regulatory domain-containing protein [Burkholderiaceae bacterium]|nr:methyltransferase regulatory domain-containing protein [Burkholderiaceae bacterium]
MEWDQGYVVDAGYTYGYYPDMSPVHADFALLTAGHAPIPPGPCCELGFGQGVSICVHSAAQASRLWWGNDFNPGQVRHAQRLVDAGDTGARLSDQSFAEFCARDDLPQFSFIALHGIWSWISPADHRVIVEFLRRRLVIGGVLYISYNTLPGWAVMTPVRQLFIEHARSASSASATSAARMGAALDFVEKLLATKPPFAKLNPAVPRRVELVRADNLEYLPHEYLNAEWHLPTFSEMSRTLQSAKLSYVGAASLTDRIDVLHLDDAQRKLLSEIPDPVLRETTRDFLIHQQFRREYWVKGESRLPPAVRRAALDEQKLVLSTHPSRAPKKVRGARGELALAAEIYEPLLEVLHEADAPIACGEITATMGARHKAGDNQVAQALSILVGQGIVHPTQDDAQAQASAQHAQMLNRHILEEAASDARTLALASPVIGAGMRVSHTGMLFMRARLHGADTPQEMAQSAMQALERQGSRVSVDGKAAATREEGLAVLNDRAREHTVIHAPIYRRLQLL